MADPERSLPGGASALELMLDGEDELAKRRLERVLKSKLPELRDEHREVIEGLVMNTPRMKLREMAEIQGVSTPTVHYRLKTALKKLLELVEEKP
jgi:RNA polymerase sigma factor (sigma-70 family)